MASFILSPPLRVGSIRGSRTTRTRLCAATPPPEGSDLSNELRSSVPTTQILALLRLPHVPPPASVSMLHSSNTLTSPHLKVRLTAVSTLGKLRQLSEFRPLLSVLRNEAEDDPVRSAAASALGELLSQRTEGFDHVVREVVAALLHAVATEEQFMIRYASIVALGEVGDLRALPSLVSIVKEGGGAEVAAALDAIGEIGQQDDLWDIVVGKKANSDELVRAAVVRVLARWRSDRAVLTIKEMEVTETNPMVLAIIQTAL